MTAYAVCWCVPGGSRAGDAVRVAVVGRLAVADLQPPRAHRHAAGRHLRRQALGKETTSCSAIIDYFTVRPEDIREDRRHRIPDTV